MHRHSAQPPAASAVCRTASIVLTAALPVHIAFQGAERGDDTVSIQVTVQVSLHQRKIVAALTRLKHRPLQVTKPTKRSVLSVTVKAQTFFVEPPVLPSHPCYDHAAQWGQALQLSVFAQLGKRGREEKGKVGET